MIFQYFLYFRLVGLLEFSQFFLVLLLHVDYLGPMGFILTFVLFAEGEVGVGSAVSERFLENSLDGRRPCLFAEMVEVVFDVFEQFLV